MNSFREAYDFLVNLKDQKGSKVVILFSKNKSRMQRLVDLFIMNSGYNIRTADFQTSTNGSSTDEPEDKVKRIAAYLKKGNPDYIVLENNNGFPLDSDLFDNLCKAVRQVGKKTPIIIMCNKATEVSKKLPRAMKLDVPILNSRTLRVCPTNIPTDQVFLSYYIGFLPGGIFWVNSEVYEKFIKAKLQGDNLFSMGCYREAYRKYDAAYTFYCRHSDGGITDIFIELVMYVRCYACFTYGNMGSTSDFYYMKFKLKKIIDTLKEGKPFEAQRHIIEDYEKVYEGLKNESLDRGDYLLFLNEYAL